MFDWKAPITEEGCSCLQLPITEMVCPTCLKAGMLQVGRIHYHMLRLRDNSRVVTVSQGKPVQVPVKLTEVLRCFIVDDQSYLLDVLHCTFSTPGMVNKHQRLYFLACLIRGSLCILARLSHMVAVEKGKKDRPQCIQESSSSSSKQSRWRERSHKGTKEGVQQ